MPKQSLLKYNNPVVVNTTNQKYEDNNGKNMKQTSSSQEMLNLMFPPETWFKDDQMWTKSISSTPATRSGICKLTEDLDLALKDQKANMFGICHIREGLFSECFDELIRQVTISCTERGSLLLRIRDDIHKTTGAYRNLYESSVTFGIRKALVARQEKEKLGGDLQKAIDEKEKLQVQVRDLEEELTRAKEDQEKQRKIENEKNETEIKRLNNRNKQIKEALERFLVEGQVDLAKTVMSDPKPLYQ